MNVNIGLFVFYYFWSLGLLQDIDITTALFEMIGYSECYSPW